MWTQYTSHDKEHLSEDMKQRDIYVFFCFVLGLFMTLLARTASRNDRQQNDSEGGVTCNIGPRDRFESWAATDRTQPVFIGCTLYSTELLGCPTGLL